MMHDERARIQGCSHHKHAWPDPTYLGMRLLPSCDPKTASLCDPLIDARVAYSIELPNGFCFFCTQSFAHTHRWILQLMKGVQECPRRPPPARAATLDADQSLPPALALLGLLALEAQLLVVAPDEALRAPQQVILRPHKHVPRAPPQLPHRRRRRRHCLRLR
jgi:hypothetical protein